MSVTIQELLPLKEDNLKLKENFKEFWKKHESNKKYIFKEKVKEFMEQQEILIENLYHKIENIIVKDNDRYNNKTTTLPVTGTITKPLHFQWQLKKQNHYQWQVQ